SSWAAERFCAQRVPLLVAISSASAPTRASARVWRIWASTRARAAGDLAGWSATRASSSARRAEALLSANWAFRGLASASASIITDLLQLVERIDGLLGGHFVWANGVERLEHRVLAGDSRGRLVGKER